MDAEQKNETSDAAEQRTDAGEASPAEAGQDTAETPPAAQAPDDPDKLLWREGLVQEAMGARPELKQLGARQGFDASRRAGHDLGFEDGARKLTVEQLGAIQALKDRLLARYALHEMPADLRGYLKERCVGKDEIGFLTGYVNGVADFLAAYKEQLRRQGR